MKKYLIAALLGMGLSVAASAADVSGVWVSKDSTPTVSPGTMTLGKDGSIVLAPEGFEPLKGSYKADNKFIDVTTSDRGKATLAYTVDGKTMTVQYENGTVQKFTKTTDVPAAQKGKKK